MKKRSRFRRLLLARFILGLATPFVAFGISNLYLVSPKGRAFIAAKIQQNTGLESSVEGGSWSPWNGISVYGLRVEQPLVLREAVTAPLGSVEMVRIRPAWWKLIRNRRLQIKVMDLEKPSLTIPIELLSQIPRRPQEPQIAANQTTQPIAPAPQPAPIQPIQPEAAVPNDSSIAAEPHPPVPTIESIHKTEVPTVFVKISDGSVKVVSAISRKSLFEIAKINGSLPLAGKSAEREFLLKRIRCMDSEVAAEMTIPVKWNSPALHIGEIDGEVFGLDYQVAATIAIAGGIPFQIGSLIPVQNDKKLEMGELLSAEFGKIGGQGRFQGQLLAPATWQGQWFAQCSAIEVQYAELQQHFDEGQAIVVFANGVLSCVDARLTGDSLSFRGNASLLNDGRAASNIRIIAPPETLVAISKYTEPEAAAPALTPLSTPQRAALDLSVFGRIGEFYFKPNPQATPILLQ